MLAESWSVTIVAGIFGLVIGSFLNVVIYRLPKMMERQWATQCAELNGAAAAPEPAFNLAVPRSSCPNCGHVIRWYENIPILSYLLLRGHCSGCHKAISPRYPLVELATGLLFAWCAWHWGWTPSTLAWCIFSAVLLALALIDWDTTLLPDDLTLPLLWAGLIASALRWIPVHLADALWGAVAGYLILWLIYWAFKLLTGKEGMGYGDFKLLATLGAWFGWQGLIPILLMSSVIGALIGIGMKASGTLRAGGAVPFGPFLALAGLTAMIVGPAAILGVIGL
jgi:leader peptidase (prepilin peptidase)/N-methyltransferase